MKSLESLKVLINLFLIGLVIGLFFQLGLTIINFFNSEKGISISDWYEIPKEINKSQLYISAFFTLLSSLLFLLSMLKIKIVVDNLLQIKLFEEKVSSGLIKAGGLLMISSLFHFLPTLFFKIQKSESIIDAINPTFNFILFPLIIGLLLRVLGIVIKIAEHIKQENELTI